MENNTKQYVPCARKYTMNQDISETTRAFLEQREYIRLQANRKRINPNLNVDFAYMSMLATDLYIEMKSGLKAMDLNDDPNKVINSLNKYHERVGNIKILKEENDKKYGVVDTKKQYGIDNPLLISEKQIKENISANGLIVKDEQLHARNLFWSNRANKNLTKIANLMLEDKLKNVPTEKRPQTQKEMENFLLSLERNLAASNKTESMTKEYRDYLLGKSKKSFKAMESTKILDDEKKKILLKQASTYCDIKNVDNVALIDNMVKDNQFLMQYISVISASRYTYLIKEYSKRKIIEIVQDKKEKQMPRYTKVSTCKPDKKKKNLSRILCIAMKGYNGPILVHTDKNRVKEYLKEAQTLDYEDRVNPSKDGSKTILDTIVLCELNDEQKENLVKLDKKYRSVDIKSLPKKEQFYARNIMGMSAVNRDEYDKNIYGEKDYVLAKDVNKKTYNSLDKKEKENIERIKDSRKRSNLNYTKNTNYNRSKKQNRNNDMER